MVSAEALHSTLHILPNERVHEHPIHQDTRDLEKIILLSLSDLRRVDENLVFPDLDTATHVNFLKHRHQRRLEQLAHGEYRELNRLKPLKRAHERRRLLAELDMTNELDKLRAVSLLRQLGADFTKAAKYKSISTEQRAEYYQVLLETAREYPGFTYGDSTEWMMSQVGIGIDLTCLIMDDVIDNNRGWEWADLSRERLEREAEKRFAARNKGKDPKDWTDADRAVIKADSYSPGNSSGPTNLYALERDEYRRVMNRFYPANLNAMVDPKIEYNDFLGSPKYDEVCRRAKDYLPFPGNPYFNSPSIAFR